MDHAVELNRQIRLQMEGSVGWTAGSRVALGRAVGSSAPTTSFSRPPGC